MTVEMVAFLRARLDEDDAAARAANEANTAPWRADLYSYRDGEPIAGMVVGETMPDRKHLEGGRWDNEGAASLSMEVATAQHVARHDPARVLAEVAAKRAILDELDAHEQRTAGRDETDDETGWRCGVELAVMHLVAVYDGDPDFDPAWRVKPLTEADYRS